MKIQKLLVLVVLLSLGLAGKVVAQTTYTWSGTGSSNIWATSNDWGSTNAFPGSVTATTNNVAEFNTSGTQTITSLGQNITIGELLLTTNSGNVTISDSSTNTLTMSGTSTPISISGTETLTLNLNTAFVGGPTVSVASGSTLQFGSGGNTQTLTTGNGALKFSGGTTDIGSGVTITSGGASGGLEVTGSGSVLNLGTTHFSGTFTSNVILVGSGATLNLQANPNKKIVLGTGGAGTSSSGAVYVTSNGVSQTAVLQFAGPPTGSGETAANNVYTVGANISGGGTATITGISTLDNALGGNMTDVLYAASSNTLTITSVLVGSSTGDLVLQFSGGGTIDLAQSTTNASYATTNTANGTEVGNGTNTILQLDAVTTSNNPLIALSANTQVDNGATIQLLASNQMSTTATLTINGAGGATGTTGALENKSGTNTFGAAIALGTTNATISADTNTLLTLTGGITNNGHLLTVLDAPGSTTTVSTTGITGSGGLTANGSGILDLTATNTFSGNTTIGTGTLEIGGAGLLSSVSTAGTYAGNISITNTGTFNYASSSTNTLSGAISGAGKLTQSGSGTLILTGTNNTYTGTTSITAGTLELSSNGSLGGTAVTVSTNATLFVNSGGTIGQGAAGSLTVNNGGVVNLQGGGLGNTLNLKGSGVTLTLGSGTETFYFDVGSTADEVVLGSGNSVLMSSATLDVDINGLGGLTGTNVTLISAPGGGLAASTSDYVLAVTGTTNGYTLVLDPTSTALILEETISASAPAVAYWTGTNSASWTVAGNFSTTNTSNVPASAVPGSATDVVFGTSSPTPTNLSTTLDAPTTINSLTFATSSNVSIASGGAGTNTLTLEAATTTSNGGLNVAPNGIKVNSGAGTVAISASVVLGTNQTWTNSSTHTLTVSGNVSGGFGLTTAGSGTIALTTNNNYTGGTTITAGVLAINSVAASGSAQSLGTGSNLTLAGVSSSSNATLDYTGGTATFGQNITVSNGDYGTVENGGSGVLNLSGSISKNGSVLTLSGGKFVVSGVISGTSNNSDLDLNATTVALSNTNSYNGPTSIANGSYLLTAVNNALPTPTNTAVTFGLPTDSGVTNTLDLMGNNETVASLNVGSTNSNVVSQVISSASTVNGSNITISGSPSGTVGTLTVATTTNDTFSGSLGGSGSATNFNLVKSGTGTLVLSGTNTYTGSTTITGGGIDVTGSTLSTAIGVGNGGTLSGTGFVGAITVNSGGILSPGAAPYNLQPKLSASSNNVLTGTSLTVHGGSILSYNLYNATGNTGTALSPAGGTVVNLGLGAFDLAGDVTSGAPVIINLNNTASAGFGTITDGIPNVYNLVEFGSGDTNITLADLTNGDFSIENLSSVLNPANSAYLTLTNLGDGQEALQLDVVPEPGTWALFGLGLGFLFFVLRKRMRFGRKTQV